MSHYRVTPSGLLVPFAPAILRRAMVEAGVGAGIGMEGLYRLQARRADGSVRDSGWFKNLITDPGLNRLGSGGVGSTCVIGTGTATPAVTDSALQALAASTTTIQSTAHANAGSPDYYLSHTRTFRFAIGALNGNYTEVGIGWGATTLFSRALILDGGGSPVAFPVLSDEQLDVIYQLRMYMPLTDWGGTYTIGGVSTDVVGRRYDAAGSNLGATEGGPLAQALLPHNTNAIAFTGGLSAVLGTGPTGTQTVLQTDANSGTWTPASYSGGSLERSSSIVVGLNKGNLAGGIGAITNYGTATAGHGFFVQYSFDPKIPKDATKTLTLTTKISWGRR